VVMKSATSKRKYFRRQSSASFVIIARLGVLASIGNVSVLDNGSCQNAHGRRLPIFAARDRLAEWLGVAAAFASLLVYNNKCLDIQCYHTYYSQHRTNNL
jgi:hypothetical protein